MANKIAFIFWNPFSFLLVLNKAFIPYDENKYVLIPTGGGYSLKTLPFIAT